MESPSVPQAGSLAEALCQCRRIASPTGHRWKGERGCAAVQFLCVMMYLLLLPVLTVQESVKVGPPFLCDDLQSPAGEGCSIPNTVGVVLTVWKRQHLSLQLDAVASQTMCPKEVHVMQNEHHLDVSGIVQDFREEHPDIEVHHTISSKNTRFHGRFHIAYQMGTEHVSVWDDDIVPARNFLRVAVEHSVTNSDALVGGNSRWLQEIRAPNSTRQGEGESDVEVSMEGGVVDFVGHSWTLRREHLRFFLGERQLTYATGEDIQLAYALQKHGIEVRQSPFLLESHCDAAPDLMGSELSLDKFSSFVDVRQQNVRERLFCQLLLEGFRTLNCRNCGDMALVDRCVLHFDHQVMLWRAADMQDTGVETEEQQAEQIVMKGGNMAASAASEAAAFVRDMGWAEERKGLLTSLRERHRGGSRVFFFMGTRPEIIKMAPIIHQFWRKREEENVEMQVVTVFMGQHLELGEKVAGYFNLTFDIYLEGVMEKGQTLSALVARLARGLEEELDHSKETDVWVVQGDTTSVLAVAVLGFNRNITVCHVEAGLRSGVAKQPFPEEYNRRVATLSSQIHFAPTERARHNLLIEGVDPQSVFVTGNTVMDATAMVQPAAQNLVPGGWTRSLPFWLPGLGSYWPDGDGGRVRLLEGGKKEGFGAGRGGEPEGEEVSFGDVVLVSLHRRESLSDLKHIFGSIRSVKCLRPCLFVVLLHPNEGSSVPAQEACKTDPLRFLCVPALSYPEMHWLLARCSFVITDSGGLTEEASFYHLPVLVARNVTDRPESVDAGTSLLVGSCGGAALEGNVSALLSKMGASELRARMSRAVYPFGTAGAAAAVFDILCGFACGETAREKEVESRRKVTLEKWRQGEKEGSVTDKKSPNQVKGERVLCFSTGRYGELNNDVISLVHAMYVANESGRMLVVHEPNKNDGACRQCQEPHSLFDVGELMTHLGLKVVIAIEEMLPAATENIGHASLLALCYDAMDVGLDSLELWDASREGGGGLAAVHVHPSELFASRRAPHSFMQRVFSLARFPRKVMQDARAFVLKEFEGGPFLAVHSRRFEGMCQHMAQDFSKKLLSGLHLQGATAAREEGDGNNSQLAGAVAVGIAGMCKLDAASMMRLIQEVLPERMFKKGRWLLGGDREVQGDVEGGNGKGLSVFLLSDRQGPGEADGGGVHGAEGVHSVWCESLPTHSVDSRSLQHHRPAGRSDCVMFDMAVATLADHFVGNPLSTLSVNVARMRRSLGGHTALEADKIARGPHVAQVSQEHEGTDGTTGKVSKSGGTLCAGRRSVLLNSTVAKAVAEAYQSAHSWEGAVRGENIGKDWSFEVEEALLWLGYSRSIERGENGHFVGGTSVLNPENGSYSPPGKGGMLLQSRANNDVQHVVSVLPAGFEARSTWVTRGECFSHVRSACLDMASGEILSFDDESEKFAEEETLRTCYNPHCSSLGTRNCSGFGTVNVKHYSTAGGNSTEGMPQWERGLGLEGLVLRYGRGILSERGSSAAAFLSSWTMEGSLWHVVLDNIAGFWEMLHEHYAMGDLQEGPPKCPDLDVIFTSEILGRKGETVCIPTASAHSPGAGCGPWGNSTGLLFYTAFSADVLQGSSTSMLDLRDGVWLRGDGKKKVAGVSSLRCYQDMFVGYPMLHPEWHEHKSLFANYGDCLVQQSPVSPLLARRQAADSILGMRVLVASRRGCRRSVSNFGELEEWLRKVWTGRVKSLEFVFFEDMDRQEQLRVVSEADVFAAPHGSALAWMSVMPQGGAVVVLRGFPNAYYPKDFLTWSSWVGVHYLEWSPSSPQDVTLCNNSLGHEEQLEMLAAAQQGILPGNKGMQMEMDQSFRVSPAEFGDVLQEAIDTVLSAHT